MTSVTKVPEAAWKLFEHDGDREFLDEIYEPVVRWNRWWFEHSDMDGDGMPDIWEAVHGINTNNASDTWLDSDADGMPNWQEYLAGTDPTDALSYLKIESITANSVATLMFHAVSNKTYTVEYTGSSVAEAWSKLADVVARPVNREERVTDPAYQTNRFYRLVTPSQP